MTCTSRRELQYLAQQDTKSTYSEIADFHSKQETNKKNQNHDRRTAHGTTVDIYFFWPAENPPIRRFIFFHAYFTA